MVVRWVVRARGRVKERVAKMFNKAHDQITMGGKTISGKIRRVEIRENDKKNNKKKKS